jgi:hypothetical protein
MVRIVIVEKEEAARRGLQAFLAAQPDFSGAARRALFAQKAFTKKPPTRCGR